MGSDRLAASLFLLLITAQSSSAQSSNNNSSSNNGPYLANANFNPSMAIVIVVLISAFFFLGFFSIYIRQCADDRLDPRSVRASASAAGRSRRSRGLDPDVLASFPTLLYSDVRHLKIGERTLECAVCLSEFDDSDSLRLLPKCSHAFHPDCIDAWLAAHITCPVCRSNLVPDPNDPQIQDPCCPPDSSTEPAPQLQEPDHVAVEIDDDEHDEREAEMENLERFVNTKRAKSRARPANLLRSHSTGHSLVQPGENLDRFTLRLPEDVRREIVSSFKLQRAKSLVAFPTEESSRRGFRGEGSTGRAGVRLGRSDRWGSFLMRTLSVKNWGRRDGEGGFFRRGEAGSGSMKGDGGSMKGIKLNAVIAPFDCYGGGASGTVKVKNSLDAEDDESSASALNRV